MIFYLILFLGAFLPFQFALNPATGVDLGTVRVFIPFIFLLWVAKEKKRALISMLPKDNQTTTLLYVFLTMAMFSVIYSQNYAWSIRKLLFIFSIIPLYFVINFIFKKRPQQYALMLSLTLGAALVSLLAILQFFAQFIFGIDGVYKFFALHITPIFLGKSFSQTVLAYPSWLVNSGGTTYMRAFATFPDPHMLSYFVGMLIPWTFALKEKFPQYKNWLIFSSFALITTDVLTFTRGGYIALIVSSLAILPLLSRSSAKKIVSGAFILFILFTLAPKNPVASRLASSTDINEGSNHERLSNWQQAVNIIKAHPLGVGIGMYSLAVDPKADYREPIYAHDLYLDIAAELGLPALIIFIFILAWTIYSYWRKSKKDSFFIAGVASLILFATHSLVEDPFYSIHVLTLLTILLALSSTRSYVKNLEN